MDGLLLKWMIWGYPYFWKHPYSLHHVPTPSILTSDDYPVDQTALAPHKVKFCLGEKVEVLGRFLQFEKERNRGVKPWVPIGNHHFQGANC